jgi:hypothetical protein
MKKYAWEATHIAVILGVIVALTVVTQLTGTPVVTTHSSVVTGSVAHKAAHAATSNPREVIVGPSGINNRYTLVSVARKPLSSTVDELTVRLHVASLATENLVSPFESDMLDLRSPGLAPIHPKTSFHRSMPAGESEDRDVVFHIPASLILEKTTLQIHYFNYQQQIPISLVSRASTANAAPAISPDGSGAEYSK